MLRYPMELSEEQSELIDKALLEALDDAEEALFNEQYENEAFREAFDSRKEMVSLLRQEERSRAEQELQQLDQGKPIAPTQKPRKPSSVFLSIAASITLFLVIGYQFIPTKSEVYHTHFAIWPAPTQPRGEYSRNAEDEDPSPRERITQMYKARDWQGVIDELQESQQSEDLIYLGCSFMEMKEFEKAKSAFEQLKQSSEKNSPGSFEMVFGTYLFAFSIQVRSC